MTGRDPAKPVRTTKPGDPPVDLNAELELGHGIITALEQERDGARRERDQLSAKLTAARKENDDLVVKTGALQDRLNEANVRTVNLQTQAEKAKADLASVTSQLAAARNHIGELMDTVAAREDALSDQTDAREAAEAGRNEALTEAAGLRTAQARFAAWLRDHQADAKRKLAAAAAELASKRYRGKALVARHAEAKGRAEAYAQAEARLP